MIYFGYKFILIKKEIHKIYFNDNKWNLKKKKNHIIFLNTSSTFYQNIIIIKQSIQSITSVT